MSNLAARISRRLGARASQFEANNPESTVPHEAVSIKFGVHRHIRGRRLATAASRTRTGRIRRKARPGQGWRMPNRDQPHTQQSS